MAPAPAVAIPEGAAERLAGSLRIPTISSEDPAAFNAEAFGALHAYLQAAFPRVHAQLRRETVGTHSLLYVAGERLIPQSDPADRPHDSSLPSRQTAVGILSAAVARLEENQMRARLEGPARQLFDRIGPRFPSVQRAVFANLDERIAIREYETAIRTYRQLVVEAAGR